MQQRNSCQPTGSSTPRSRCVLLLALLLFWGCSLSHTAGQSSPDACLAIGDAQLMPEEDSCNSTCRAETLAALEAIYQKLGGPTWNFNVEDTTGEDPIRGNWPECLECRPASVALEDGSDPVMPSYCCWEGVRCCHEHSIYADALRTPCRHYSVFLLELRAGNLTNVQLGPVMEDLATLHRHGLVGVDMSRNEITGPLPPQFNNLTNLQLLLLGANNISGTVPDLSALTGLRQLDLEFNFLHGQLSGEMFCPENSNRLNALMLRANNFTGSINLRTCRNLTVLDLQDNGFSGSIPVGTNNTPLHVFRGRNNNFSGTIPDKFWELPQLITVDLSNNSLTGTLADTIGVTSFLTNLYLGGNKLHGTIPARLGTSSQLTAVDLSNNAWLVGTMPSFRWMLGLQLLDLSNTRISGTIPEELGNLPFLMTVDIRNTLMTCCETQSDADAANGRVSQDGSVPAIVDATPELLPPFLQFNLAQKRSPLDERMPRDPYLRTFMATGKNLLCPTVRRTPGSQPGGETVYNPADLTGQQWLVDPEYYWFMSCECLPGFDSVRRDTAPLSDLWCEDKGRDDGWLERLGANITEAAWQCTNISLQVCEQHRTGRTTWEYVLISLGCLATLCVLVMLASLFVSLCLARTGKVRRQVEWWRKHLSGMPQVGKMSIVVTDIEGYSDLFKRCPEPMYEALTLHNNVIRRAKYANCGSTVQQEGDSYTLVFHEPLDAVAFCLQAQLALMEVQWPEGLYEDTSQHHQQQQQPAKHGGLRMHSKGRSKLLGQQPDTRRGSLLPSGPSGWLRKSRGNLKQSASTASNISVGPPSPTASDSLDKQPTSPTGGDAVYGSPAGPAVPQSSSMAWRSSHNMSRLRMLELFSRVTGSGGGTGEAELFNGLRVRMGVVTGVVEGTPDPSAPAANIMNSTLYKLALDVSDAGSGGQVLMDEATFSKVKEDLRPLGAVNSSGINYNKLMERVSLFHLLCLGSLCARRTGAIDVDEAMVLDMGQYEMPQAALAADRKAHHAGAGPPNLAGMLVRGSMKLIGWSPSHDPQPPTHTRSALLVPEGPTDAAAAAAAAAAGDPAASLATTPGSLPGSMPCPGDAAFSPTGGTLGGNPPANSSPWGAAAAGSPTRLNPGGRVKGWGASPEAPPTAAGAAGAAGTVDGVVVGGQGHAPKGSAGGGGLIMAHSTHGSGGSSSSSSSGKRVRLIQVLSPSLVGRAHVWGNKLSVRSTWVCVDAPYFEAPGALEAPLGIVPPTRALSRGNISGAAALGISPAHSASFASVAASHQSAPQLMQQGQQQQQQLSMSLLRHSEDGALSNCRQQQQQQRQLSPLPHPAPAAAGEVDRGPGGSGAPSSAAAAGAAVSSVDSTTGSAAAGVAAGAAAVAATAAAASGEGAARHTTSGSSRSLAVWPSIREEASSAAHEHGHESGHERSGLANGHEHEQLAPLQTTVSIDVVPPAAATATADQQQGAVDAAAASAAAAAAARLWRAPIPPVTMVFMLVEGAKVFGQRRKQLVKDIHAQLSQMLMLALKQVPGGYMCRMQEGDLKYMVAFSSARAALEWCLLVQEAALYLNWPSGLSKIPQLRSEYDSSSQLVFRGPRIKMGVCEGVPQSIIPNHEGRADYHGCSINQAARFMDAAAHGGQIACELDLALAVVQQWRQEADAAAAAAAQEAASRSSSTSGGGGVPLLAKLNLPTAGAAAAAADGGAAAAAGELPVSSAAVSPFAPAAAAAAAAPATLMSLDSSTRQEQQQEQQQGCQLGQQQQQQQPEDKGGVLSPILSAVPSIAAAEDDSSLMPPTAAAAAADGRSTAAAAAAADGSSSSTAVASASSRSRYLFGGSGSSNIGPAEAAAGSTNGGSGSSSSRFPWLLYGRSQAAAAAGGAAGAAASQSLSQQKVEAGGQLLGQSASAAAAAVEAEAAPRLFQLPEEEVERAPVAVQVHHLGLYKFKGNPQPLPMVNVTLACLAGRLPLLPKDPPKGKGGRIAARDGLVASCECANIPALAAAYRARVPRHVLEDVQFSIAALHPPVPSSPRRQVVAGLRTASLPARSYVHVGARGANTHQQQQQQQQQRMQNLQLAALEGGYGGAAANAAASPSPPYINSSSSSVPGSPVGSPRGLAAAGRSSSFTTKLFGKQGGSRGQQGAAGSNGHARAESPAAAAAAAAGMAGSGKGGGAAAGDVVLQVGPAVQSQ